MSGAPTRRTTRSTRVVNQNTGQQSKHPAAAPSGKDKSSTAKSTSNPTKSASTTAPPPTLAATALAGRKRKALGDNTNAEKKKKMLDQTQTKTKERPKPSASNTPGTGASTSMRMVVELPMRKRRVSVKPQTKAVEVAEVVDTTMAEPPKPAVSALSPAPPRSAVQHIEVSPERVTRSKSRPQANPAPDILHEPITDAAPPIVAIPVPKAEKTRASKPKPKPAPATDEPASKRRRSNDQIAVPVARPDVVEAALAVPSNENDNPFEVGLRSTEVGEQVGMGTAQRWDDLDEEDMNDPLMVAEYVVEIFGYMKELELRTMPSSAYMNSQPDLDWNMRGILMDWLIQVHARFKMLPETLFLATNIIDRFLSLRIVSLIKLQLVGITALFVASKYEEIMAPSVSHFLQVSDSEYTEQEILGAEKYVLRTLEWNLSYPNPMSWLRRASKADAYDPQTRTLAKFLVEISIVEERLIKFTPSMLAAAALWLARLILERDEWDANLEHYSGYPERKLLPCANVMLNYIIQPKNKHDSLWKKYSAKKFFKCAVYARKWAEQRWPPGSKGPSEEERGDDEAAEAEVEVEVDLFAALPVLREQILAMKVAANATHGDAE